MSLLGTLARGAAGFIGGGPAGAALAVGSSLLNRKGGGGGGGAPGGDEAYYSNRFRQAMLGLGGRAETAENRYLADMDSFDPEASFSAKTTADLDAYDENFARSYADRMGKMVGGGRNPTSNGFGLRDAQDTIRQGMADRSRIRQQNADELARMRMQKLGMQGEYATGARNLYMDAVSGRLNTLEGDRMQDAASKRGLVGGLFGAAATGLGAYFGSRN